MLSDIAICTVVGTCSLELASTRRSDLLRHVILAIEPETLQRTRPLFYRVLKEKYTMLKLVIYDLSRSETKFPTHTE